MRGMHNLPGKQGRSVPFVRPTKSISKANIVVAAAPEHVLDTDNENENRNEGGLNGSRNPGEEYSAGLLAVHGGELSGRPKVSGTWSSILIQSDALIHRYHALCSTVRLYSCVHVF